MPYLRIEVSGARRFYRPVKQTISLRLDAEVVAWLKKDGKAYQTRANLMLRERMLKEVRGGRGVRHRDRVPIYQSARALTWALSWIIP